GLPPRPAPPAPPAGGAEAAPSPPPRPPRRGRHRPPRLPGRRRGGRLKLYVVTTPAAIRGIYETWNACRAAVSGVRGARYQAVSSRAQAEALLSGEGLRLVPGRYAFVDGNAMRGVGVVLVDGDETAN